MKFSSVVIGLDFSPALQCAGSWAKHFLEAPALVSLVHAIERPPLPLFIRSLLPSSDEHDGRLLHEARERVADWADANGLQGSEIFTAIDRPHHLIDEVVRETSADLLVLGAHAGLERPWQRVGSTTERLLRSTDASVLVIHGQPRERPRRILVAIDDVAIAGSVLEVAGGLADCFDASIHGIHVLSNAAYSHVLSIEAAHSRTTEVSHAKVAADIAEITTHWLTALCKNALWSTNVSSEVAHGIPGDEILAAADRQQADLIVIGRYGIGRVIPAVLGSVVGSVVHGAKCPVLVVSR